MKVEYFNLKHYSGHLLRKVLGTSHKQKVNFMFDPPNSSLRMRNVNKRGHSGVTGARSIVCTVSITKIKAVVHN